MRRWLFICACTVIVAAAARPTTPAQPSKPDKLQAAVEHLMTRLLTDEKDLRVGMDSKEAAKALATAANLLGTYYMPLEGSKLAPKGNWSGVINAFLDPEEGTAIEWMEIALFCDKYDKAKMREFLMEAGSNYGILDDESDSNLYYCTEGGLDLVIALGDTAIAMLVEEATE